MSFERSHTLNSFERLGSESTGEISAELLKLFCELDHHYFPNPWELTSWQKLILESSHELHLSWATSETNEILGLCLFLLNLEDSFAHLVKIFTRDDIKRLGLGSELLSDAQQRLKELGVRKFYLEVESDNQAAIQLYLKFDYKKIHHRRDFYGNGRHADIMELCV